MKRIKLHLRLRIALAFAAVCITVVAALGVTLYTASEDMETALVEQIVSEEVDYLITRYRNHPDYRPSKGANLQYFIVRTPEDAVRLPPELRALPPGNHETRVGADEYYIAVRHVDDTYFYVAYEVGQHEEREQRFKALLLLSLASVAVIGLVLGYWLAGVLTRQLTELAGRVARLSPDEAHAPLVRPDHDAEVAALARALDDYQVRIARLIEREKEFTANASHELRTPLTAIRTSCELLLAEPGLPDKASARVRMIDQAAHRMGEQLQTLLFIAREQALGAEEEVALAECVRDAAEPHRHDMVRKGLAFTIDIDPGTSLNVNRHALHTVISNLIRNAVQHTDRGFVKVGYSARRLMVTDSGSGIAPESLRHIFERFYRGGEEQDGFGLGLAIVKRICDHYGWRIEVKQPPAAGSAFCIDFP
jgi:signal transduction histidine kinase